MLSYDAVVIGAGAAGLFCAGLAGQSGVRVLLIDHADKVAEKIRISGGGRCNFTNRGTTSAQFLSANPQFCRSALARYTPQDFLSLMQRYSIAWHEKHKGQLFCDRSAEDIIQMLLSECAQGGVEHWQPCKVHAVRTVGAGGFEIDTDRGCVHGARLILATGGLSIPQIGATDFGFVLARQFGHRIQPTYPALVPLTFDAALWEPWLPLAGVSLSARVRTGKGKTAGEFVDDLLFTHRGLSGPAVLQISSYWQPGQTLDVNLSPHNDLGAELLELKGSSKRKLSNELAVMLPSRLAHAWLGMHPDGAEKTMPEQRDKDLMRLAASLQQWQLTPQGTLGYRKAEVTAGGVDTRELSSQTMESQRVAGLYFIGEVVDVTGWLGGYNFQWAWASAAACAKALVSRHT